MAESATEILTREACYEYIYNKVFPLRPADYCTKYPNWPGLVGLEIEMLPLMASDHDSLKPRTVPLFGPASLVAALEALKEQQPQWRFNYQPDDMSHLLTISLEDNDMVSFEPGGQLEFSTRPYPCLSEALQRMEAVQGLLGAAAQASGIEILQIGMNPWLNVDEIGLQMTKSRYRAMDLYFTQENPYGRRMMRQTCTIQVNLDFGGDEQMMAKRFLLANLLAPFATASFANSPLLDGRPNQTLSNRSLIWQNMDQTRTGFPQLENIVDRLGRKSCADAYFDLVQNGRVVFIESLGYRVMDGRLKFGDWIETGFEGVKPQLKDLQTHLSLMFPEVRARGFMELRSLDCQPRYWQSAPAAYYVGLLYDEQALHSALDLLLPLRSRLREFWKFSSKGLQQSETASVSKKLMTLAIEGFSRLPPCFQGEQTSRTLAAYAEQFIEKGLTPADAILAVFQKSGGISAASVKILEETWQKNFT